MALPVILVDSTAGAASDSLASGAGPSTALTGTAAATDGAGTTVTLDSGTVLTGVDTTGLHVIYLVDATAGARNFGKITGSAGSGGATPTVTVADAFGLSLSGKSWAIGGKRATIGSASSVKLIENNGGNGDAMPGWAVEMQSGHVESPDIAATINPRRNGDSTNGAITIRGASGAVTRPIVTFSNNGQCFTVRGTTRTLRDFELKNSNVTKNASIAITLLGNHQLVKNIKIDDAAKKFWRGVALAGCPLSRVEDCSIQNCASVGIDFNSTSAQIAVANNVIASNGSHGFASSANLDATGLILSGNVFAYNTGDGFNSSSITTTSFTFGWVIRGNVFHGNTSDGIEVTQASTITSVFDRLLIENNRFTLNGAYGLNFSGSSITDSLLRSFNVAVRGNNFYLNTSNPFFPTTLTTPENTTTADPSGGLASATKDYTGATGGTNFMSAAGKGTGYPVGGTLAVGAVSSSYNYQDPGLGHQDAGGGGGTAPANYGIRTGGRL